MIRGTEQLQSVHPSWECQPLLDFRLIESTFSWVNLRRFLLTVSVDLGAEEKKLVQRLVEGNRARVDDELKFHVRIHDVLAFFTRLIVTMFAAHFDTHACKRKHSTGEAFLSEHIVSIRLRCAERGNRVELISLGWKPRAQPHVPTSHRVSYSALPACNLSLRQGAGDGI